MYVNSAAKTANINVKVLLVLTGLKVHSMM